MTTLTGRTVEVDGGGATRIHLDGEPFGSLPLRVSLVPGALDITAAPAADEPPPLG